MRWKVVMALAQLLSWRGIRPTPWSRCWQRTQRKTTTYLSLQINAISGAYHQLDAPAGLCLLSWRRARVQAICRGRFCFHRIECKTGWGVRSHKYLFASGSRAGGTSSRNVQRAAVPLQPQQPIFQGTSNKSLEWSNMNLSTCRYGKLPCMALMESLRLWTTGTMGRQAV